MRAQDTVLKSSKIGCKIGLHASNPIYTWKGFCDAVVQFNSIAGTDRHNPNLGGCCAGLALCDEPRGSRSSLKSGRLFGVAGRVKTGGEYGPPRGRGAECTASGVSRETF